MPSKLDLNLLHALDALLQEESVTKAAQRAHMTTPAMSRALGRLRTALGDELLVRAGRVMVLTPVALSLRERVHETVTQADALLGKAPTVPLSQIERTLTIRGSDTIAALLATPLLAAAKREAPGVRLRFIQEGEEDAASLRDGRAQLDVGALDLEAPELRRQLLAHDEYVGVARAEHPFLSTSRAVRDFAKCEHIAASRRGKATGPIDVELAKLRLTRSVVATTPDFLSALHVVASSDLLTAAPSFVVRALGQLKLTPFALPVPVPRLNLGLTWHPRYDADPAHQWVRAKIMSWVASL